MSAFPISRITPGCVSNCAIPFVFFSMHCEWISEHNGDENTGTFARAAAVLPAYDVTGARSLRTCEESRTCPLVDGGIRPDVPKRSAASDDAESGLCDGETVLQLYAGAGDVERVADQHPASIVETALDPLPPARDLSRVLGLVGGEEPLE